MEPYISQETAYRLLAGRLLASLGAPGNGSNSNTESNPPPLTRDPGFTHPPQQRKFIGSDYQNQVLVPSSSNNNSINSGSGHDSSTSLVNSPGSGTDHSGSFSAPTPGSMINLNTVRANQRPAFTSTPPVADTPPLFLSHGKVTKKPTKTGGGAQCPECNKRFNNSSALAKHKLIHNVERRYTCPKCGKGFKRQDHLSGHMMTHEEQKPYRCYVEACDKSYCDSRSLRRHLENHHGVHIESPFICPPEYPPSAVGSSQQPVRQGGKGQVFSYEAERIRQLSELNNGQTAPRTSECATTHFSPITPAPPSPSRRHSTQPGISIVQCSLCSKKFRSLASLNGHMRIHGPRRAAAPHPVREDSDSNSVSRQPSPIRPMMVDGGLEKHTLPSASSCVFTPGPMAMPPTQQSQSGHVMRPHRQVPPGGSNSEIFMPQPSCPTSSEAAQPQLAHSLRQPPLTSTASGQVSLPLQAHSGPLDLAFPSASMSHAQQNAEEVPNRMAYQQSSVAPNVPNGANSNPGNQQSTASLALAMMKAALPGSFPVDQLNATATAADPRSAWLQSLYNPESSSLVAQMYQQQQPCTSVAQQTPINSSVAPYQMQQPQPKFTVPQSPRSFLRSRFGFPPTMHPSFNPATSWTPFPNGPPRQTAPQMKDIGTSPFVTLPKDRQVFFPPDNEDQSLSTHPQCSPSTPGTISVVGDHPPLSAGPMSAGYISVVGTPPQRSPAVFGTPGSGSHGAANSSGGSDNLPACRMTPCPPSPITINTTKANVPPPPPQLQNSGLLMPAPSPQKIPSINKRMPPPNDLPPPPLRPRPALALENDENNRHQEAKVPALSVQTRPRETHQDKDCDHLSDLDSSPELFDIDPHIYLKSPPPVPQTAPPVLFSGSSDPKKFKFFSFEDCDLNAVKSRDIELRTPSPVPDEEMAAHASGPLPSPGIVFKSPQLPVPSRRFETTPEKQEPQVIPQPPVQITPPVPAELPTSPPKSLSTSSTTSDSVPSSGRKRPRPPPLPIFDSNYGPVSHLRSHVEAVGSANSSSIQSASTVSSAASTASSFGPLTVKTEMPSKPLTLSVLREPANLSARFIPPYTPPPILSPFRGTPGTFWALKQTDSANLASSSASSVFFSSSYNNGEGTPLSDRRPRINVGSLFQAEIPPYRRPSLALREADRGTRLFDPGCLSNISQGHIQALCELARSSAAGSPHGSNIELVMHLLSAMNGSIEKVTLMLLNAGNNSDLPPAVAAYRYQENSVWTAEEIRLFISIVGQHKKDFFQISKVMRTKSVKECIEFYYLWKRLFSELTPPGGEPPAKRQRAATAASNTNGRVAHPNSTTRQNIYFCDLCPKVFDKERAKSFHMKVYHPSAAHAQKSSTASVATSLLASSKQTSTCCQLVFAPTSSPTVHTAQVAQ